MKLKIRLPKALLKLALALKTALAVIIAGEVFILYQFVYLDFQKSRAGPEIPATASGYDFSLPEFAKVRDWLEKQQNFEIPPYELTATSTGRENPFAEY